MLKKLAVVTTLVLALAAASLLIPEVRQRVRAVVRPEPPARITPLAVNLPPNRPPTTDQRPTTGDRRLALTPSPVTRHPAPVTRDPSPSATSVPTDTPTPAPTPTPEPLVVNGRVYDAYIPAATKDHQTYKYSCEFDAAWVILQTYGIDADVDQ